MTEVILTNEVATIELTATVFDLDLTEQPTSLTLTVPTQEIELVEAGTVLELQVPGPRGPQGERGEPGPQGDPGPISPANVVLRGPWSALVDYDLRDIVTHEGSTWFAYVDPPLGAEPDALSPYWTALALVGSTGPRGASAYEVALDEGFVGTVEEWLESLVGPQGPQGVPGAPGLAGINGQDGVGLREVYLDTEPVADGVPAWLRIVTSGPSMGVYYGQAD